MEPSPLPPTLSFFPWSHNHFQSFGAVGPFPVFWRGVRRFVSHLRHPLVILPTDRPAVHERVGVQEKRSASGSGVGAHIFQFFVHSGPSPHLQLLQHLVQVDPLRVGVRVELPSVFLFQPGGCPLVAIFLPPVNLPR